MTNIDFLTQQDKILNFIKNEYKNYMIDHLPEPNAYIGEALLDFDKYRDDFTLFTDFGTYEFSYLSNESTDQDITLNVYLVVRNDTDDKLRRKLLRYTTSFFKFFDATGSNFGGAVDYGIITDLTFYPYAEGQRNIKVSQVTITLRSET
jgi:hypothetical protein